MDKNKIYFSIDEQKKFFTLVEEEKENEIKNLLKQGGVYEIWNYRSKDNNNSTLLHVSVYTKNIHITQEIIDYVEKNNDENKVKSFINEKNDLGITALHYASFKGNLSIIKLLMQKGADLTLLTNNKLNIIHYCAQGNKPSSLMYFYYKFKEKDAKEKTNLIQLIKNPDISGSTPLHWAAYSNSEDILIYLINLDIFKDEREKKDFINKKDNKGDTPLNLSVSNKYIRITKKLLQNGSSSIIKNNSDKTAYELSIEKNYRDISALINSYQKCQLCTFQTPVKAGKKSHVNIIIIFIFQIISFFIMFFSTIPIGLKNEIFAKVLFCFYNSLLFLFFVVYFLLLYKDPGEIQAKRETFLIGLLENNEDLSQYCYKCYIKKDKLIRHCIICDKCYDDFDHHCYWINKCVAKKNYKLFFIFLFVTFFYLLVIFLISIFCLYRIFKKKLNNFDDLKDDLFEWYLSEDNKKDLFFEKNWLKYFHLIVNIIHLLIISFFLFSEGMLLLLHIRVSIANYKQRKTASISLDESNTTDKDESLMNSFDDNE